MEIIVTPKKEAIKIDLETGKKIKLKVAGYARVSTDLDDQKNSFEFQKLEFETRIKQNPEWEFVGMYSDEGISGRPGILIISPVIGMRKPAPEAISISLTVIMKSLGRPRRSGLSERDFCVFAIHIARSCKPKSYIFFRSAFALAV